ncbi:hypothetical protein [Polaribacter porphyrae]|uniref:Uncharacterized protein n=1 Tax=Polaribacter porphyrae TaxID=1137780 RepID=A0A2S7WN05_9FLAO|nr:hypothetical protein [Polaribacter porphyrae]PQJ78995.1 hypothetical protein BTO18_07320 [Polaribacter porphyrae]
MKKRNKFLAWLKPNETLVELDSFYRETVSQFSNEERKVYCKNLLGRLQEDFRLATKAELNEIKKYLKATKRELKFLNKQNV